jgi:hypothetical protein
MNYETKPIASADPETMSLMDKIIKDEDRSFDDRNCTAWGCAICVDAWL